MPSAAPPSIGSDKRAVGAALAWVWPGLGHLYIGQRTKGLVILIALTLLYLLGLLIGGIDVVDAGEDALWFAGQLFMGPVTLVVNFLRGSAEANPVFVKSIGRVNEIGTLYCAMAGLLNLLAIIDVAVPRAEPAEHTPEPALQGRVVQREDAT